MFAFAFVQTKVISCNSANKNCLFQVMNTKAIAALMQFCDFYNIINEGQRGTKRQRNRRIKKDIVKYKEKDVC